jgi:hypothetical protein
MLVAALGYDAQKLNGKDWAKHTYDAAIVYNIITAEEFALDFDRETAILYAYNALISEKPDGFNGTSLATSRFKLTDGYTFNNYGAPTAHVFKSNGKEIASIEVKPTSVETNKAYTIGTTDKGLTGTITYVEDGVEKTTGTMGGNSATVAVYEKYDGTKTRVVVVNTLIAKMNDKETVEKYDKVDTAETLKIGDVVIYTQGNTKGETLDGTATIETAKRVTAVPGSVSDIDRTNKWVNVDGVKKVNAAKYTYDIANLKTGVKYNFYYDDFGNIVNIEDYTEPAREGTLVFLLGSVSLSTYDASDVWNLTTNDTYQAKYIDLSTAKIETVDANLIDNVPVTKANLKQDQAYAYDAETYNRYYWAYENEDGTVDFEVYNVDADGKGTMRNVTYGTATITKEENQKPTVTLQGAVTDSNSKDASGKREFTTDSDTKLTVITYTGEFENLTLTTTTGYTNFEAAAYTSARTYATAVSIDTTVTPSDVYVIAPLAAPAQTTAYMMYVGTGVDHANGGQEYYFVDSFGVKQTLTYDVIPGPDASNPSNGYNAPDADAPTLETTLEVGSVYKLTLDKDNVFIAAVKQTAAKSGEIVKVDAAGYVSLGTIANYNVYSAFCGKKVIATDDGSVVEPAIQGTDKHGCAVTGTTVSVYTDDATSTGKIVFITTTK